MKLEELKGKKVKIYCSQDERITIYTGYIKDYDNESIDLLDKYDKRIIIFRNLIQRIEILGGDTYEP